MPKSRKVYFTEKAFEEGMQAAGDYIHGAIFGGDTEDQPECPWPLHSPEGRAWVAGWNGCVVPAGFGEDAER